MAQAKSQSKKSTSAKSKSADPELLLRLYEEMLLIRRFEERAGQLYGMGLIGGFCHL
ncbi:MAG: pyruvate dehydrogenase (acetyl-transferring) E1 component subunit alpha, partial [Alphaproteobacteria bacterium]